MSKGRKGMQRIIGDMNSSVTSMLIRLKRDFIAKFWASRAEVLEQQAVMFFREAGKLRALSEQIKTLPDDGVETIWNGMDQKNMVPADVKTVVESEEGTGKVN